MDRVEITIGPGGETKVEVLSGNGPDCKKLTAELEKALGSTVTETKKPEFHHQQGQNQGQQQGYGL